MYYDLYTLYRNAGQSGSDHRKGLIQKYDAAIQAYQYGLGAHFLECIARSKKKGYLLQEPTRP